MGGPGTQPPHRRPPESRVPRRTCVYAPWSPHGHSSFCPTPIHTLFHVHAVHRTLLCLLGSGCRPVPWPPATQKTVRPLRGLQFTFTAFGVFRGQPRSPGRMEKAVWCWGDNLGLGARRQGHESLPGHSPELGLSLNLSGADSIVCPLQKWR